MQASMRGHRESALLHIKESDRAESHDIALSRSDSSGDGKTKVNGSRDARGLLSPRMPYELYYATSPAPADLTAHEARTRLIPVSFSTADDALHAAALVIRGGQHVWLLLGPGIEFTAADIEERCRPILEIIGRKPPAA